MPPSPIGGWPRATPVVCTTGGVGPSPTANQIAADVGAASPRGPLKDNEVGHIAKSVARWVWERYGADVPPLLREARIAAQRERQATREEARERSEMTRAEIHRSSSPTGAETQEMRTSGIFVREIARVLVLSVREVYRLLASVVPMLVDAASGSCTGCAGFARPMRLGGFGFRYFG